MVNELNKRILDNGMVLLSEPMDGVESAAFGFLLPAGASLLRSASISNSHIAVGGVLEASNLSAALDLYADVILKSLLHDEQFEPAK
ncbi:MAG: hypothetical protein ACYTE8_02585, partial [Planctomycetota bacterium]